MALELSDNAKLFSSETNVKQQLILELEGFQTVFGVLEVKRIPRYGDSDLDYGMADLKYGENVPYEFQKPYISLDGTTNTITQQLEQDKGSISSISNMRVALIDKNGELSELFAPSNIVDDVLGIKAKVFIARC